MAGKTIDSVSTDKPPNKIYSILPNLFTKIQLNNKLSDTQKIFVAVLFSIIIGITIVGSYNWFTNENFRSNILGKNFSATTAKNTDTRLLDSVKKLNDTLVKINPEDIVYKTINFEDLPIYPKAWVEKRFSSSDRSNALISGPSADPDGDGLSNKQEYLYGSNPNIKDTLCDGKNDTNLCKGRNDKQNVDAGISPLTGLDLNTPKKIKIPRQDLSVIAQIQDSFENASKEGVDFPELYQKSRSIDLSKEMDIIEVSTQEDTRDNILNYQQARIDILKEFVDEDEVASFTNIYQYTKLEDLSKVKKRYTGLKDKLQMTLVPKKYKNSHKAYVLVFQKLVNLIDHRENIIQKNSYTDEVKQESQKKVVEVFWGYRRLNEEITKLQPINQ